MSTAIYNLLDPVEIPEKDPIVAVDLLSSKNRSQNFGIACMKFSGFIKNSELEGISKLQELQSIVSAVNENSAAKEDQAEETIEAMAAGVLTRGFITSADFGANLTRKFEEMRTIDKSIVSHLDKPLSDLAWGQIGWQDKQNIAAGYAAFFMQR